MNFPMKSAAGMGALAFFTSAPFLFTFLAALGGTVYLSRRKKARTPRSQ